VITEDQKVADVSRVGVEIVRGVETVRTTGESS